MRERRVLMGKELIRSSVFLEEEKTEELRKLSYFTRTSMATYIREGIDLVLDKYKGVLRKAEKGGKEQMTGG
jgi:predicted DNA-binding protein